MLALALVCLAADPLPPGAVARLGSARLRHPDRPTALAFLPDGKHLVSGGADGSLRVWAVADGREVHAYRMKDGAVNVLAVAADGRIAAHFGDSRVRLFTPTLSPTDHVLAPPLDSLALSPDGALVVGVAQTGKLIVKETATGLDRLALPDGRTAAIRPGGKQIAVADAVGGVAVYDALSGEPVFKATHLSREGVTSVAFSPDGTKLAAADNGATAHVRVWTVGKAEPVAEWNGEGPVAFADDTTVVGRRNGAVAVWVAGQAKPVKEFGSGVETLAVSADGKLVATGGRGARIAVRQRETGEELRPDGDGPGAAAGVFPADKGLLAVGTNAVTCWRPGDAGATVAARTPLTAVAAVGGGKLVTAGGGRVAVWDDLPANEVRSAPSRSLTVPDGAFTAAAVSADGTRAAVGTDEKRVVVFDPRDGKVSHSWAAPGVPLGLAFLPNSPRLAVVGRDGFARLWDLSKPTPGEEWSVRVPRGLKAGVAASLDGKTVAVASVVKVEVFDAATGKRVFGFDRKWEDGPFQCVDFSADGRLLAAGAQGSAGGVSVWEVATRGLVRRFVGDSGTVARLAFLPGGRHLAAAGLDENVLVWDLIDRAGKAEPTAAELDAAWLALLRQDPAVGVAAVRTLAAAGPKGVAVVKAGIADAANTGERIKKWVAELDSPAFADREQAQKQLTALGLLALPAVEAAAAGSESSEVRQRAAAVRDSLNRSGEKVPPGGGLYAEPLRLSRAAWVLELVGEAKGK